MLIDGTSLNWNKILDVICLDIHASSSGNFSLLWYSYHIDRAKQQTNVKSMSKLCYFITSGCWNILLMSGLGGTWLHIHCFLHSNLRLMYCSVSVTVSNYTFINVTLYCLVAVTIKYSSQLLIYFTFYNAIKFNFWNLSSLIWL